MTQSRIDRALAAARARLQRLPAGQVPAARPGS